jgi:hypothetical protein
VLFVDFDFILWLLHDVAVDDIANVFDIFKFIFRVEMRAFVKCLLLFPCGNSFPSFLGKFVCVSEYREKSVENSGKWKKCIIILVGELKSKAGAGNADTRSRRLRSTFPGTGAGARRREAVTI